MQLTNPQLTTLRTRPHQANLYLSIYQPKNIMVAQVTGSYNIGDSTITYYGVLTGQYSSLYPDMTVMVGSTPYTDDIGRIRLRSATGTYVVVAENAVNWQTNQYLTFIDQIDVEAIYPRIIQDPSNPTNVIFYKDYDIPYSNQNRNYGTFINMGSHRAGFIPSGTAYFSASGTYNVLDEALTYNWAFEGGTPTGSTAMTPGDVRWQTPGHYKVRLRVNSASGVVDEAYRYVSWYKRPNEGNPTTILRWELDNLNGSRSEGGYTATIRVYDNIGEVQPNALVVIFSDNFYGGTRVNLGGNQSDTSIFFVGYILEDSIKFDYESSSVEFQVGSISEVMKRAEGFSVSCESKASPTTWFELYEMNIQRAIYHYLRWHSTVLKIADFQYTSDNRLVQYFDTDRGSLYDAIDTFVREGLLGGLVTDRQGKLWAEINPFGLETPFTSLPNGMTFHKHDWMDKPMISERRVYDMSFVELGGIAYYGVSTNGFSALLSNSPSTVPLYNGKAERLEGLILSSQAQLNQVAGNYLAYHNTRFHDIALSLNGIYTNLDIAPLEKNYLIVSPSDTVRNKGLEGYPYFTESMEWKYTPLQQSLVPSIVLNPIATGTAGVTVNIPVVPPDNGYSYPNLSLPPLPDFGGSTPVGSTIPLRVVMHDTSKGIIYTDNFDSSNPQWVTANAGLTLGQYQSINCMFVTPNGAFYVARIVSSTSLFIARAPYVGAPFTIIEDNTSFLVKFPTATQRGFNGISFNPNVPETVAYVLTPTNSGGGYIYIGSNTSFAQGVNIPILSNKVVDNDGHRFELKYSLDEWVLFALSSGNQQTIYRINKAGSSIIDTQALGNSTYSAIPRHAGQSGQFFLTGGTGIGAAMKRFDGNDAAHIIDVSSDPDIGDAQGWAVQTVATPAMMMHYGAGNRGRSSDGGATWNFIPNLPLGTWVWAYAGTGGSIFSTRWIAASGVAIRFSQDWGNAWYNKEGNLAQIVAVPDIDLIIVPGVSE